MSCRYNCGQIMQNSISRIKNTREILELCYINKGADDYDRMREILREDLNDEKKYLKKIELLHKLDCLGETYLILRHNEKNK